ncbi:MAG: hypothetical protein WCA92_09965 [Terriglobales bacterium]
MGRILRWTAVIGLVVATVVLYRPHYSVNSNLNLSGYEMFAVAESLVQHHSFSDPFDPMPTGPTAHVGPLFPAYLAFVITVFGRGSAAVSFLMWWATALAALQVAILPVLAKELHLGFWTGALAGAGWLASLIPPASFTEVTFTSFLVIAASFLMARCFAAGLSRLQWLLWAAVWAAILLLQPAAVLVLVFCVALVHFQSRRSARQKIALVLLPVLLVAPWMARNLLVFHKLFFVRDNLGMEMAVSNRSCATALFDINDADGCFASTHPNENYEEAMRVRELGEIEYNRLRMREAIEWIGANRGRFAELSLERFEAFWFPPVSRRPGNGVILRPWVLDCFTLLSIPGLFVMWKNARVGSYVAGLWLVFFPLTYYFFQFLMRYRYPILWATFVPGSYFVVELVRGIVGKEPIASNISGAR